MDHTRSGEEVAGVIHAGGGMTDMEILRSAGLYQEDRETGKAGYNLAAILLFGRDEVIRSCTANYVTDAICRRENIDRYDDRLMVTTNLIDAYELLIEFINKHTYDRFFLIDDQSVSVRSKIAREIVSNILVHREYTSAYPAKIIVERNRIVTENWSLPKTPGRINPDNFTPYPKNPLLASFFINIGRADVLGSGVRNLYKFTKMYSHGDPELVDGDIFKTILPINLFDEAMSDNGVVSDKLADNVSDNGVVSDKLADNVSDNGVVADKLADNVSDNGVVADKLADNVADNGVAGDKLADNVADNGVVADNEYRQFILAYISEHGEVDAATVAKVIECSPRTARRVLARMAGDGVVVAIGANRNRKYRGAGTPRNAPP